MLFTKLVIGILLLASAANAIIPAVLLIGGRVLGEVLKKMNSEKHVKLVNTMGRNVIVTANCASGDDRVGEYKLKDGEGFAWKFKPHFLGRTLFWCDITTNTGKRKHWDVYRGHQDSQNWYLRGDGGYTGKENGADIRKQWSF